MLIPSPSNQLLAQLLGVVPVGAAAAGAGVVGAAAGVELTWAARIPKSESTSAIDIPRLPAISEGLSPSANSWLTCAGCESTTVSAVRVDGAACEPAAGAEAVVLAG